MDPRIDLIERAYAALDADDVPAFLELFAADAVVEYPASPRLPYGGVWSGHDGIAQFLDAHEEMEEILEFESLAMAMHTDAIFVNGFFRGRSRRTGRTWETKWVHRFDVEAERITRWEAYFDTVAAVDAHGA